MNWKIEITYSKIFSLLLLIFSFYLAIFLKDYTPFISVLPVVGGIIINKQYNDRKKDQV